jgi:peroxiredoxin
VKILLEKFQDKVDWNMICRYQQLNEKFIRKHLDKLNIKSILKYQELNDNFKNLLRTYSSKEIELLANKYNINIIKDNNGQFTKEFIEEFKNKIN